MDFSENYVPLNPLFSSCSLLNDSKWPVDYGSATIQKDSGDPWSIGYLQWGCPNMSNTFHKRFRWGAIIIRKCCGEGISEGVAPLLLYLLQFWWLMLYYIHIDRKNYPPTTLTHLSWIIAIHGTLHHGHHPSGTFRIPLATEGLTVHASSEVLGPQEEGVHHETWGLKRQTWRLSLMCDRYVGV